MLIQDFTENFSPKARIVWSKRGDGIEKRVEKKASTEIKPRKYVAVKDRDASK